MLNPKVVLDPELYQVFLKHPAFSTSKPHIFIISSFFLSLARIFPIMMQAPFFGAKVMPAPVKVGFSLSLYFVLFPTIFLGTTVELDFNMFFIMLLIKELFIGFILGYLAAIPFHIAQASGTIVDHQRGTQNLQAQDPSLQTQSSPIGLLYNYLLIVIFFSVHGPFLFLDVLLESYSLLPIDGFFSAHFYQQTSSFWPESLAIVGQVVRLAVQLASPALLTILMTDLFLGVSNRLAPQVQIIFLGMPLKALLGFGILYPAWEFIIKELSKRSIEYIGTIKQYIQMLSF